MNELIGRIAIALHQIKQRLEKEKNKNIMVLIHSDELYNDFFEELMIYLKEENYIPSLIPNPNPKSKASTRKIQIKNNSNTIKILTLNSIQILNPKDLVTPPFELRGNEDDEQIKEFNEKIFKLWKDPIHLILLNMPDEFYKEDVTIENIEIILNKYKNYIKL